MPLPVSGVALLPNSLEADNSGAASSPLAASAAEMPDPWNISSESPGSPGAEAIVVPVVFALIFLLGTVGNGLVLAGLLRPGQSKGSPTDLFILNLAVADLCFLVCCVPFQAVIYTLDSWPFGTFACKAVHLLIYLTMYASSFTLAAISVDRYLAIRYPLRSRALRTAQNAWAAIGLIWLLALLFSGPYAGYYWTVRYGKLVLCVPGWEDDSRRALDLVTFAVGYLLPVAVVSLAYARILCFLWAAVDPTSSASEARRRAKGRASRTMLAVAALFGLCWLPHHVVILYFWFGHFRFNWATYACRLASHCLSYANSCLNPLVYALASKHFRKRFRHVCPHCCRSRRHQCPPHPGCAPPNGARARRRVHAAPPPRRDACSAIPWPREEGAHPPRLGGQIPVEEKERESLPRVC
ncbi:galanin receptor type 3 isoform X1 [Monodelphis domestica]|uniref:galanin receptor type 3 isoform X1 n=2 Tax=Monodelphis domestica TaxID=13616 RepID=UPI0024E23C1D|nr:galanin receptor type 3 isoform X1 [Monodelphis domestica]